MRTKNRVASCKVIWLIAAIFLVIGLSSRADVVVLQNGTVLTGRILQRDANGVLLQLDSGTYRYPESWIKEVKRETAVAPSGSDGSQAIPDWTTIVTRLADTGWAPEIKQVPATVINYGNFKDVPYVSFRCAYGGYAINIFGDLNHPAAVQAGALNQFKDNSEARSNCLSFICSLLGNAEAKKIVRGLSQNQADKQQGYGLTAETVLPGDVGSYGGWWVSVYDPTVLAEERASDSEIVALTETSDSGAQTGSSATNTPPASSTGAPASDSGQITSYGTYTPAYGWTPEELAAARRAAVTLPAESGGRVYPRTYVREGGTYGRRRR